MHRILVPALLLLVPAAGALQVDADACDLSALGSDADLAACTADDLVERVLAFLDADADADVVVEVNVAVVNVDDDLYDHYAVHAYATDYAREAVVLVHVVRGPGAEQTVDLLVGVDAKADRHVDGTIVGTQVVGPTVVHVPACADGVGPAVHPAWSQGGVADAGGVCVRQQVL